MKEREKEEQKVQSESLSWVDLSDEELVKVTDTTVCMYGKQAPPVGPRPWV